MINRIAAKYNLDVHETPVGFNYIADHMLNGDVLIGGEESGGISIKGHIPEGDGILLGLLILEVMAATGKPLHELVAERGLQSDITFTGQRSDIREIYDNYGFETQILAASIRSANHMSDAAKIGADVATAPPDVIRKMAAHPLTDKGLEGFLKDWAATGQSIL